jgi:hypothetical protein
VGSNEVPPAQGGAWLNQIGDTNPQSVHALATDDRGNAYVAGQLCAERRGGVYKDGSFDFGTGSKPFAGECALFAAAYAQDGKFLWSYVDGEHETSSAANAIAVNSSGHVVVGGKRGKKMVIIELSGSGAEISKHVYGDPDAANGQAEANSVAPAADGEWVVAGEASDHVDLGAGLIEGPAVNASKSFVARYRPDGKARWVRFANVPSKYVAGSRAVSVAADGTVVVCGVSDDTSDVGFLQALDGVTGEVHWTARGMQECNDVTTYKDLVIASGTSDALLVARDFKGNVKWQLPQTPTGFNPEALATDGDKLIVAGGEPAHTVRVLELDAKDGKQLASKTYTADLTVAGIGLASDHSLLIAGTLEGSIDFGLGASHQTEHVSPEAVTNTDAVVARLTHPW